jgi:hypothetical protein
MSAVIDVCASPDWRRLLLLVSGKDIENIGSSATQWPTMLSKSSRDAVAPWVPVIFGALCRACSLDN